MHKARSIVVPLITQWHWRRVAVLAAFLSYFAVLALLSADANIAAERIFGPPVRNDWCREDTRRCLGNDAKRVVQRVGFAFPMTLAVLSCDATSLMYQHARAPTLNATTTAVVKEILDSIPGSGDLFVQLSWCEMPLMEKRRDSDDILAWKGSQSDEIHRAPTLTSDLEDQFICLGVFEVLVASNRWGSVRFQNNVQLAPPRCPLDSERGAGDTDETTEHCEAHGARRQVRPRAIVCDSNMELLRDRRQKVSGLARNAADLFEHESMRSPLHQFSDATQTFGHQRTIFWHPHSFDESLRVAMVPLSKVVDSVLTVAQKESWRQRFSFPVNQQTQKRVAEGFSGGANAAAVTASNSANATRAAVPLEYGVEQFLMSPIRRGVSFLLFVNEDVVTLPTNVQDAMDVIRWLLGTEAPSKNADATLVDREESALRFLASLSEKNMAPTLVLHPSPSNTPRDVAFNTIEVEWNTTVFRLVRAYNAARSVAPTDVLHRRTTFVQFPPPFSIAAGATPGEYVKSVLLHIQPSSMDCAVL